MDGETKLVELLNIELLPKDFLEDLEMLIHVVCSFDYIQVQEIVLVHSCERHDFYFCGLIIETRHPSQMLIESVS